MTDQLKSNVLAHCAVNAVSPMCIHFFVTEPSPIIHQNFIQPTTAVPYRSCITKEYHDRPLNLFLVLKMGPLITTARIV